MVFWKFETRIFANMKAWRQLYGTTDTSRDVYHESAGLLGSVEQSLLVLLVFIKQIHKRIWEPALTLYVFSEAIWFGLDC